MADFPENIYAGRELENADGVVFDADQHTRFFAEDLNSVNDEITAIETVLGENPQGEFDTVSERIAAAAESGGGGSVGREPLTNGDPDAPELLFADGDVIMS